MIVFPGRIAETCNKQQFEKLGEILGAPDSFSRWFTPQGKPIDGVIEVLAIHSGPRTSVELSNLPEAFHPYQGDMGWDYWKVYSDEEFYHEGNGHAYDSYRINLSRGTRVILRPDQYVNWVREVDDYDQMSQFFAGFMKNKRPQSAKIGSDAPTKSTL